MRLWCSSCATQASSRHSSTLSHSTLGHSNLLGCRKTYNKTSAVLHLPQGSPCSPVALSTEAMAKQQLFPFHPHSTLFKISDWDCLFRVGHTGRFLEISANRKKKKIWFYGCWSYCIEEQCSRAEPGSRSSVHDFITTLMHHTTWQISLSKHGHTLLVTSIAYKGALSNMVPHLVPLYGFLQQQPLSCRSRSCIAWYNPGSWTASSCLLSPANWESWIVVMPKSSSIWVSIPPRLLSGSHP